MYSNHSFYSIREWPSGVPRSHRTRRDGFETVILQRSLAPERKRIDATTLRSCRRGGGAAAEMNARHDARTIRANPSAATTRQFGASGQDRAGIDAAAHGTGRSPGVPMSVARTALRHSDGVPSHDLAYARDSCRHLAIN
jgi:hypothetical protein